MEGIYIDCHASRFITLWDIIRYQIYCAVYIPYKALIREQIPTISYPKVKKLQSLIQNLRGEYLGCIEEIFYEQKMEVKTDDLYRDYPPPSDTDWIIRNYFPDNISK